MKRFFNLVVIILCSIGTLEAQTITGCVVDENDSPIEYANIALLSAKDSIVIVGGVSNENGTFILQSKKLDALIRVSYVGYQTVYRSCTTPDLGIIKMYVNKSLGEIVVIGKRPILSKKVDKMIYNVSNDIFAKDKTGMELLEQTPRIIVDKHQGAITMVGRSCLLYTSPSPRDA